MGQAALDLTDSIEPSPAPAGSADDLLSQLAGQEIDRLLAESDAAEAEDASGAHQVPASPAESAPQPADEPAPAPVAAAIKDEAYDAQIDELFQQLNTKPGDSPPAMESAATVAKNAPAPIPAAPAPVDQPTTAAELAALHPAASELDERPAEEKKPSLLLRLMELFNAPLGHCSDAVRETLGKIAVLTLLNATGVLLYVLFFKKH